MKTLFRILRSRAVVMIAIACLTGATAGLMVQGCASRERATHNTLAALGKSVDIAEREYLDGCLTGRYKTNEFPRIQASYSAFQGAYSIALMSTLGATNLPPTAELAQQAAQLISDINAAKGGK